MPTFDATPGRLAVAPTASVIQRKCIAYASLLIVQPITQNSQITPLNNNICRHYSQETQKSIPREFTAFRFTIVFMSFFSCIKEGSFGQQYRLSAYFIAADLGLDLLSGVAPSPQVHQWSVIDPLGPLLVTIKQGCFWEVFEFFSRISKA